MPDWMKWPGYSASILFMILGVLGIMFPNLKITKGPAILFIIGLVAIIASVVWWLNIVKAKPIKYWFRANIDNYPPNVHVEGIAWNTAFTDIRVGINNPTHKDYHNLEFTISTDMQIANISQITKLPNVSFRPWQPPGDIHLLIRNGKTGEVKTSIPLSSWPNKQVHSSKYYVSCIMLPRRSHIDIILAAVTLDNSVEKPEPVYKEKRMPKWVQVSGHYQDSEGDHTFEERHNFEN